MGQAVLTRSSPIRGLLLGPSRDLHTQDRAMGLLELRDTLWACKDVYSMANRLVLQVFFGYRGTGRSNI